MAGPLSPADLRARVDALKPVDESKKKSKADDRFEALLAMVKQKKDGGSKRKRRYGSCLSDVSQSLRPKLSFKY